MTGRAVKQIIGTTLSDSLKRAEGEGRGADAIRRLWMMPPGPSCVLSGESGYGSRGGSIGSGPDAGVQRRVFRARDQVRHADGCGRLPLRRYRSGLRGSLHGIDFTGVVGRDVML